MTSSDLWLTPPVLLAIAAVLLAAILFVVIRVHRRLMNAINNEATQRSTLDNQLTKSNKQVLELRSVVLGLGQRLAEQEDVIALLNERIVELEQEDNDARLYSRATKMVQLGADINEVISECEIPKAEAELMFSLQQKLAGKQQVPPLSSHPEVSRNNPSRTAAQRVKPR